MTLLQTTPRVNTGTFHMKHFIVAAALALAHNLGLAAWTYDDQVDEMTSKTTHGAAVRSNDSLSLDFPYTGQNFGTLRVFKKPRIRGSRRRSC